jgi:t-SNARE complex subunit (syntaxin)
MTSTRHGEARSALQEVQSRHQDIQKIERTITELAQLFNEMSIMIEVQETAIDNIETKAQETETQMESGLQATEQAVVKARSARRKKWYCIGLIALIISMFPSHSHLTFSRHCCHCHCGKTCHKITFPFSDGPNIQLFNSGGCF